MKCMKLSRTTVVNGHTINMGSYIQPIDEIDNALDGELDDVESMDAGDTITLTVVEMSEEEYAKLPEFTGW